MADFNTCYFNNSVYFVLFSITFSSSSDSGYGRVYLLQYNTILKTFAALYVDTFIFRKTITETHLHGVSSGGN
jgi:hypothetical protein